MIALQPSIQNFSVRTFDNGQQWYESLGSVPLRRILFTPWPGSATDQDLIKLADENERYCEWIDGTLIERPNSHEKRRIVMRIINQLSTRTVGCGLIRYAAAVMRTKSGQIRAPDIAYISFGRLPGGVRPKERIPAISPELVIEVMTEANTESEIRLKIQEYFKSGTELVWIVRPVSRTVDIHSKSIEVDQVFSESELIRGGRPLPRFYAPVPVKKFFESNS